MWPPELAHLAWGIVWLVAVWLGVSAGIALSGVEESDLGQAGPDIYDAASADIRLCVLLFSSAACAIGAFGTHAMRRRHVDATAATWVEDWGTISLHFIGTTCMLVAGLFSLVFVFG